LRRCDQNLSGQKAGTGVTSARRRSSGLPTIALDDEEASRFLKALERLDDRTVAKLADLRRRA